MADMIEVEVTVTVKVNVRPEALDGFSPLNIATGIVDQAIGLGIDDMARQATDDTERDPGNEATSGAIASWTTGLSADAAVIPSWAAADTAVVDRIHDMLWPVDEPTAQWSSDQIEWVAQAIEEARVGLRARKIAQAEEADGANSD